MKFILGLKLGMFQIFDKAGRMTPVTLIEAGPCVVTQIKTKEYPTIASGELRGRRDGYEAVQVGFKKIEKPKKIKKPMTKKPYRYLKEFRDSRQLTVNSGQLKVGDEINVGVFQEGDKVKISGVSKGKGFAGVVKRWGFRGRCATHGTKHEERTGGSVGASFPERVVKGRKMPGRAGFQRVTIKNLRVVKVDLKNNLLVVRGGVPGRKGTLLEIQG